MSAEKAGGSSESSEQIVRGIRERLVYLATLPQSDSNRQSTEVSIRDALAELLKRYKRTIEWHARQHTYYTPSFFDDMVSEISYEIVRVVKSPDRQGPVLNFEAMLPRLAIDAKRKLTPQMCGTDGIPIRRTVKGQVQEIAVTSGDAPTAGDAGEQNKTLFETIPDRKAQQELEGVLGPTLYERTSAELSPRQHIVFELKLSGLSNVKISERLMINRDTVAADIKTIRKIIARIRLAE